MHAIVRRYGAPALVVYGFATLTFIALSHFFAKQTGDDSFIFYRIADNLRAGLGPVFNAGERVEAYSSPLWLALLAAGRTTGLSYGAFARIVGDAESAISIIASVITARRLGADRVGAALVALFSALGGSLYYWAPSGLESPLYAALVAVACAAVATRSRSTFIAALALVGIARPEGVFLVPVGLVAFAVAYGRKSVGPRQIGIAVLPSVAYELFRILYFRLPLPNTYYAKATGALGTRIFEGFDYTFWTLLLLVPVALVALREARRGRRSPLAVLLLPSALAFAVLWGGGDWMWGRRLLLPVLGPLFAVTAALVRRALLRRPRALRIAVVSIAFAVTQNDDLPWPARLGYVQWFGFGPENRALRFSSADDVVTAAELRFLRPAKTIASAFAGGTMEDDERMEGTMTDAARDVGIWLDGRYDRDSWIAVNHAGAVPFYSRLPTIDMTGLADFHIAHEVHGGLHEKYDAAYVLSRRPRAIILNSRVEPGKDGVWYHEGYWDGETALTHDPEFSRSYHAVPTFFRWRYGRSDNFILVYERSDS